MAVPADPTITQIVTEGLKRGGRIAPTAADITAATDFQFQEVKSDIALMGPRSPHLVNEEFSVVFKGISRYNWPTDATDIRSVMIADSQPDGSWNGTAQAGTSTSLTVAATMNENEDMLLGRFMYLTAGTGNGQSRQIVAWNNTTKVATVDSAWTVTPDNTTQYFIETIRYPLHLRKRDVEFPASALSATVIGIPQTIAITGRQGYLDYIPNRQYILIWDYWYALDQLDESSPLFLKHLRRYRSLWTQGVAVKTMQRYDEDRYIQEMGIYQQMLSALAGVHGNVLVMEAGML